MAIAVGMIETLGFPAVVEAADAMVKAAREYFPHTSLLVLTKTLSMFYLFATPKKLNSSVTM